MKLINADALYDIVINSIKPMAKNEAIILQDFIALLEDAPTIDAVPVIRCKDCNYYYVYDKHNFCDLDIEMMRDLDPNYYCASAERKEDDEI